MIKIITDCADNKLVALNGVCEKNFGLNNYKIIYKKHEGSPTPLSTKAMEKSLASRILALQIFFESKEKEIVEEEVIYFSTIQKGFLQINKCWIFYACAVFKKIQGHSFTGQTEGYALKKDLWPFIDLPDEERYKKFEEFDYMLKVQPLSYYSNGISEGDFYKQAFRNCLPIAISDK